MFKTKITIQTFSDEQKNHNSFLEVLSDQIKHVKQLKPNIYLSNVLGKEQYILPLAIGKYQVIIQLKNPVIERSNSENPIIDKKYYFKGQLITDNYFYAFYENDEIVWQSGLEQFPVKLKKTTPLSFYKNGIFSAYTDVNAYNKNANPKRAVIIRKSSKALYIVSNTYAYLFTIIFLLVSLYILGNIVARSNLRRKRLVNLLGLTLRMRIHLSILLVELISLILIGLITVYIFNSNSKQKALVNAYSTSDEVNEAITNMDNVSNKTSLTADSLNAPFITQTINPYLDKHEVDVNIFDLNGNRIFTTIPIRLKNIIPELMNPIARLLLQKKQSAHALINERIGSLQYYTIYTDIQNKRGEKIGYLEIPNFKTFQSIKQNNSDIVTMLINIYAFIFYFLHYLHFT